MFDMGFTELVLIGIVALIVIGPERLPGVARTAGKYLGKLRRFMSSVKADVESELHADELRDILKSQQDELQTLKKAVDGVGKDIDSSVNNIGQSFDGSGDGPDSAAETPVENTNSWTETVSPPEEPEKPKAKAAKPKVARPKAAKPKSAKPKTAKPKARKVAAK